MIGEVSLTTITGRRLYGELYVEEQESVPLSVGLPTRRLESRLQVLLQLLFGVV
jgi:hypothetical protein